MYLYAVANKFIVIAGVVIGVKEGFFIDLKHCIAANAVGPYTD